jgi:hypothetical protein
VVPEQEEREEEESLLVVVQEGVQGEQLWVPWALEKQQSQLRLY